MARLRHPRLGNIAPSPAPGQKVVIIVVMGVSGCGKSTVGAALAQALGWPFLDADEFHPPENVAKMASGVPLTDADRVPWLDRVGRALRGIERDGANAVLACSALKQRYRDRLSVSPDVRFVYLKGDLATIAARLRERRHKYMPAALLQSQFAALEEPTDALAVDIRESIDDEVAAIRAGLALA